MPSKKKKDPPRKAVPLSHPSLWPSWAAVYFFRSLCLGLPWKTQVALGKIAGRVFHGLVRFRRRVVDVNLELCFPEKSSAERRKLAVSHYEAMGIGLFETGLAWWAPDEKIPAFEMIGKEHLDAAVAAGKGVLLLTAHFTTLEICGRIFCNRIPMGGLYRNPDNPVIAHQMYLGRIKKLAPAIEVNDLRGFIRALKDGHTIWYAPDQSRKSAFTAVLPFFGVPALTNTATSRLAEMTGASVIPFFGVRGDDGVYRLEFLPALDGFPSANALEDGVRVNRLFEEAIRKAPDQYFWIHRRFKRRGKGFRNVYKS